MVLARTVGSLLAATPMWFGLQAPWHENLYRWFFGDSAIASGNILVLIVGAVALAATVLLSRRGLFRTDCRLLLILFVPSAVGVGVSYGLVVDTLDPSVGTQIDELPWYWTLAVIEFLAHPAMIGFVSTCGLATYLLGRSLADAITSRDGQEGAAPKGK